MRRILSVILCAVAFLDAASQTVKWKCEPCWDSAEILTGDLLKVQRNGLWGVASLAGKEIILCGNKWITDVSEGRFLILGEGNKIVSVRDSKCTPVELKDKKQKPLSGDLFVDSAWPYFSEGLLAVCNSKGKWGFINTSGQLVVKNEYVRVYPFRHGRSAVTHEKGNCFHIDRTGEPQANDNNFRGKRTDMSSYTPVGKRTLAAVVIGDKTIYLIDTTGSIQDEIIPSTGISVLSSLENDSSRSYSGEDFKIDINSRGEITGIKTADGEFIGKQESFPAKPAISKTNDMNIDEHGVMIVDSLSISRQFQEVHPLPEGVVLVKKGEKWGLLEIDKAEPPVRLVCKTPSYTNKDTEVEFELSDNTTDVRVYTIGSQNERVFLETGDGSVHVPTNYFDESGQIALGVEQNGILLEPASYTVRKRMLDRDNYKVKASPSKNEVKEVKGNHVEGKASSSIDIEVESRVDVPFSVYINGRIKKEGIRGREKLHYPVKIDFDPDDYKTIRLNVEIKEEGFNETLRFPVSCRFHLKNE